MKKFYIALALFFSISSRTAISQNTSPFWSLAGNSNSNSISKLGTTIAEPLNLTTNNLTRIKIFEDGRVGAGANVTNANATRVVNLVDGNAVMRILRVHPNFAPAVELISRTSSDGANVAYWDFYAEPSDKSFRIRDRIGGGAGLDRVTVSSVGNVGIGTTFPNNRLHVVGNQTLAGNLLFTNGLQSIQFANPDAVSSPMMLMFASGTTNPNRMVIGHSSAFPDWGLGYSDAIDKFDFLGAGASRFSVNLASGNIGVGTTNPQRRFHVFNGSAGAVTPNANAPFVLENSTNNYINVLGPAVSEKGILFGDPGNAQNGGIVYTGTNNTLHFRTNGNVTRMTLSSTGRLDIVGDSVSFGSIEAIFDAGANTIGTNSSFIPSTSCFRNLGSPSNRWNNVYICGSVITSSDARLKTNIRTLSYGLKEILKLRPVSYSMIESPEKEMNLGLIAQEVQKVIPEMVSESTMVTDETSGVQTKIQNERLGLKYDALIPVLVKAMQEQQDQIDKQQQKIEELMQMVNKLSNGQNVHTSVNGGTLLQNVPNPVHGSTSIMYSLPEGTGRAQLLLTDALGRTVKTVQLNSSGVVNLDVSSLSSGVYNYSLVADGKTLQTKKMAVKR